MTNRYYYAGKSKILKKTVNEITDKTKISVDISYKLREFFYKLEISIFRLFP